MDSQFEHTYSAAIIVMTKLVLSGEIKIDNRRDLLTMYVSALKIIRHRNRTAKHVKKMVAAQNKLNNLIDIGEFAAKMDANL